MSISKRLEGFEESIRKSEDKLTIVASMVTGAVIFLINFSFFDPSNEIFTFLNILGFSIMLVPYFSIRYDNYLSKREMETRFIDFLRDIIESVKAGMTLPQAIKACSKNDYGRLNDYVRKMGNQINWGIPFSQVFIAFSKNTGSRMIRRSASTIVEAHKSGGDVPDILEAVSKSVSEIERIRRERSAHIYMQMLTGYVIFFIFLIIMVALQRFLMPSISGMMSDSSIFGETSEPMNFYSIFRDLIIVQAFFAGLAIGKMSEGSVFAGAKHSVILVVVGYAVFFIFCA